MNTDPNKVFNVKLMKRLIQLDPSVVMTGKRSGYCAYVGTVHNRKDIATVRGIVKHANKMIKKAGVGKGYKIEVKGRLGKNSPHRDVYRSEWTDNHGEKHVSWKKAQRIRLEHASRFDVYLYFKDYSEERELNNI